MPRKKRKGVKPGSPAKKSLTDAQIAKRIQLMAPIIRAEAMKRKEDESTMKTRFYGTPSVTTISVDCPSVPLD